MDEKIEQTIEEMELVMHNAWGCIYSNTKQMKLNNDRFFNREATALYNAGYRKESETASEIEYLREANERWKEEHSWLDCKCKALQKQVDELTQENLRLNLQLQFQIGEVDKKELVIEHLQKQVDELKVYLASEKVCSKQAVKDKTKEIILLLEDMDKRGMTVPFNMVLRQLKERCGVEVE